MLAPSTLELLGTNASCYQSGPSNLIVLLGYGAEFEPGHTGELLSTIPLRPSISIETGSFIPVVSSTDTDISVAASFDDWSQGGIFGPSEIGPCDAVDIRVAVPSARPLFYIWDCPLCPSNAHLSLVLAEQVLSTVVIAPEDFSEYDNFEIVTVRVRIYDGISPAFMLMHSIQKVPFAIPLLSAIGPPYSFNSAQVTLMAESRPSSCSGLTPPSLVNNSKLHFIWVVSGSKIGGLSSLTVPGVSMLSEGNKEFVFQVEATADTDPRAIASALVQIVLVPSKLRILLQTCGQYTIETILYQEGDIISVTNAPSLVIAYVWTCFDQGLACLTTNGSTITLTDEGGTLRLSAQDYVPGKSYLPVSILMSRFR